jgi:hypothetical protein
MTLTEGRPKKALSRAAEMAHCHTGGNRPLPECALPVVGRQTVRHDITSGILTGSWRIDRFPPSIGAFGIVTSQRRGDGSYFSVFRGL